MKRIWQKPVVMKKLRVQVFLSFDNIEMAGRIATLVQSARCPVVKQPHLAAHHSELVGGGGFKA